MAINFVSWGQYKVLFQPHRKMIWYPSIPYSDVYINVNDSNDFVLDKSCRKNKQYLNAWHFYNFPQSKTIIFCHGNSGNISHRKYIIDTCYHLHINLFIFDYRGYGKSGDIASKKHLREDGEIAYQYLSRYCSPQDIIIWGESLGGYVATSLANRYPCHCLVLLSTFSSISDIIIYSNSCSSTNNILSSLVPMLIDDLPSKDIISHVKCPVFILHSHDDTIVPPQCALDMLNQISHSNKHLEWITGDHCSPHITSDQLNKLFIFMNHPIHQYRKTFNIQSMLDDIAFVVNNYLNHPESSPPTLDLKFIYSE
jgi:hypothetical protein